MHSFYYSLFPVLLSLMLQERNSVKFNRNSITKKSSKPRFFFPTPDCHSHSRTLQCESEILTAPLIGGRLFTERRFAVLLPLCFNIGLVRIFVYWTIRFRSEQFPPDFVNDRTGYPVAEYISVPGLANIDVASVIRNVWKYIRPDVKKRGKISGHCVK